MSSPQLVVGARVLLYVNGRLYGRVSGFQWSSSVNHKGVYALDSLSPVELLPTQTKVIGNITVYRVIGDGGAEGPGFTTNFPSISRMKYFTLALVARYTQRVLFEADRCVLQNQSWNAPTRGFVTGSLSFEALDWDENEAPEPPA